MSVQSTADEDSRFYFRIDAGRTLDFLLHVSKEQAIAVIQLPHATAVIRQRTRQDIFRASMAVGLAMTGQLRFKISPEHIQILEPRRLLARNTLLDRLMTRFVTLFDPSVYVGPASMDFLRDVEEKLWTALRDPETRAELTVSDEDEPIVETITRLYLDGLKMLDPEKHAQLSQDEWSLGELAEEKLRKHYPDVLDTELDLELSRLFTAEAVLKALRQPGKLAVHISRTTGIPVQLEKTGSGEYTIILGLRARYGRTTAHPKVRVGLRRLVPLLSRFLELGHEWKYWRTGRWLLQLLEEENMAVIQGAESFIYMEPGLALVCTDTRKLYCRAFRNYRRLARYYLLNERELPIFKPELLEKAGPSFYGSEQTYRKVVLTGCLGCEKYILINENIAVGMAGDGFWVGGLRVGSRHVGATGAGPTDILRRRLLPYLVDPESPDTIVVGVEKYAPDIIVLRRVLKEMDRRVPIIVSSLGDTTAVYRRSDKRLLMLIVPRGARQPSKTELAEKEEPSGLGRLLEKHGFVETSKDEKHRTYSYRRRIRVIVPSS